MSQSKSEKISKKRGRPVAFGDAESAVLTGCGIGLDCGTRRGKQNAWYRQRALCALNWEPQFAWLVSTPEAIAAGGARMRFTILAELGRLGEPEAIREMATVICEAKPLTTRAVNILRSIRTGRTMAEPPAGQRLIDLTIGEAARLKWEAGQRKHGTEFVGDPVEELFAELIDGLNYCDEARRQGVDLGEVPQALRHLADVVQQVWKSTRAT